MAILFGTTSTGTTLPVLVDQFGNLLAKGIPGDEGPPGPPGSPGGSFALPPNPVDGDVLGWENGALVWISDIPPPLDPGFVPVIYTGSGAVQSITSLNFQPDFCWIKTINETENHFIVDSVRGVTKQLYANLTNAESTSSNRFISFNSNGFTVGTTDDTNQSGISYVAWCWKAGGAASSNSNGTITSSVSANAAYGFSVVTWTGQGSGDATIGHGLSNNPKLIIVKGLTGSVGWSVGHDSIGWTKRLKLNDTDAESTSSSYWNDTAPTSSVFTSGVNNVNNTFVAYCWAEIPGLSSFGSYIGNGSATGPLINCGFKPSFLMIKAASVAGEDWVILDSARNPSDPKNSILKPNTAQGEFTSDAYNVDFTDSGFQILNTNPRFNGSGTYIYAAFK